MAFKSQEHDEASLGFCSSITGDVWHRDKAASGYEWWYFDAVADDGNEAVLITFFDNFVFSSRYNRFFSSPQRPIGIEPERVPAIAFTYFLNGRTVIRTVNEYREQDLFASQDSPECSIGPNTFKHRSAEYGSGYFVSISLDLPGKGRVEAHLEWLSIESNLLPDGPSFRNGRLGWNMAVPRADVSGRITTLDRRGHEVGIRHFRGTGYHDHKCDDRWLAGTVREWAWGRAHFADSTAVFHRYSAIEEETPSTKLLLIKDGVLTKSEPLVEEQFPTRHKFGVKYPTRIRVVTNDNVRLRIKPMTIAHSSVYMLRFLGEFTLTLRDGIPRKTTGLMEFLSPRTLRYRWLNWLGTMRSKKAG